MQRIIHLTKALAKWIEKDEPPATRLHLWGALFLMFWGSILMWLGTNYLEEYELYPRFLGFCIFQMGITLLNRRLALMFLFVAIITFSLIIITWA